MSNLFSEIVFLLGAGASAYAECKLSKQMLDDLLNRINIKGVSIDEDLKKCYLEIYDLINASLHYQSQIQYGKAAVNVNIEDFVATLDQIIYRDFVVPYPLVGNWSDKISKLEIEYGRKDTQTVFEKFRNFIQSTLINSWLNHNEKKATHLLKPLKELVSNNNSLDIDIFTLNYDLTFEKYFNKSTIKLLNDGFESENWTGQFLDNTHPINYYKLHGSINWYFDTETETVRRNNEVSDDPLIIFGTNSKMLSIEPFVSLLTTFREKLIEATLIIAIGYSFHDKYLNNIIIQQIMSSQNKKLVIVDPYLKKDENDFVKRIENFQNSKSIYDRLNFTRLNKERVKILTMSAQKFYSKYLGNDAQQLEKLFQEVESENNVFV